VLSPSSLSIVTHSEVFMLHSFYKEQGQLVISYYKSNKANYYYEKETKTRAIGKAREPKKDSKSATDSKTNLEKQTKGRRHHLYLISSHTQNLGLLYMVQYTSIILLERIWVILVQPI